VRTIEQTSTDLDTLIRELSTLRTQNRALQAMLPKTKRSSSTVRRAVADAHTLVMNAWSGDATGRLAMEAHGMTKSRWAWAVALLRFAGIVSTGRKRWRAGLEWLVTDLDDAVWKLEAAATELDDASGFERLRALLRQV
jgi:ribosomal protein L29